MEHSTGTIHTFRHALLRDVAYELHVPSERAALHFIALRAMEQLVPDAERDTIAGELAEHARRMLEHPILGVSEGERSDIARTELSYLQRAARVAEQAYNNELAETLYARCVTHPIATVEERASALLHTGQMRALRGRIAECEADYQMALEIAESIPSDALIGTIHTALGTLFRESGRAALAEPHLHRAVEFTAKGGQRESHASAQLSLAALLYETGRVGEAEVMYRRSIKILGEIGARMRKGIALGNLAVVLKSTGRLAEAREMYEESLAIHRESGSARFEGIVLGNLASLERAVGRMEKSEEMYRSALAIVRRAGDRRAEAVILSNLPILLKLSGRIGEGEAMFHDALRVCREIGERRQEGFALGNLGALLGDSGRLTAGEQALASCLSAFDDVGDRVTEAVFGCVHGNALLLKGNVDAAGEAAVRAMTVLDESRALPQRIDYALLLALRLALTRSDQETANATLAEMRQLVAQGGFAPQSGPGETLAKGEQMVRDATTPGLFNGHLADELSPAARMAIFDRLKHERPREYEKLQESNPALFSAMLEDTAGMEMPDWRSEFSTL